MATPKSVGHPGAENEELALHFGTVADAVDHEGLLEALGTPTTMLDTSFL